FSSFSSGRSSATTVPADGLVPIIEPDRSMRPISQARARSPISEVLLSFARKRRPTHQASDEARTSDKTGGENSTSTKRQQGSFVHEYPIRKTFPFHRTR